MSLGMVFLAYGSAFALASLLLYFVHAKPWYWHAISLVLAVAIGLVRFPPEWHSPYFDLLVGAAFVFLFVWGIGAPFFHGPRHPRHA